MRSYQRPSSRRGPSPLLRHGTLPRGAATARSLFRGAARRGDEAVRRSPLVVACLAAVGAVRIGAASTNVHMGGCHGNSGEAVRRTKVAGGYKVTAGSFLGIRSNLCPAFTFHLTLTGTTMSSSNSTTCELITLSATDAGALTHNSGVYFDFDTNQNVTVPCNNVVGSPNLFSGQLEYSNYGYILNHGASYA